MADPIRNLWQCLDEFHSVITGMHASLPESPNKTTLGNMLQEWRKARGEAERVVPGVVAKLQKDNESLKAWAEQFKPEVEAKLAELEKMYEAEKAAEADRLAQMKAVGEMPAAAAPVEVIDGLGAPLSQEVLQKFGPPAVKRKERTPVDEGSIAKHWDHWEEAETSQADSPAPPLAPPPVTPAPATPGSGVFRTVKKKSVPPRKAPPNSGNAWEGLSQTDE